MRSSWLGCSLAASCLRRTVRPRLKGPKAVRTWFPWVAQPSPPLIFCLRGKSSRFLMLLKRPPVRMKRSAAMRRTDGCGAFKAALWHPCDPGGTGEAVTTTKQPYASAALDATRSNVAMGPGTGTPSKNRAALDASVSSPRPLGGGLGGWETQAATERPAENLNRPRTVEPNPQRPANRAANRSSPRGRFNLRAADAHSPHSTSTVVSKCTEVNDGTLQRSGAGKRTEKPSRTSFLLPATQFLLPPNALPPGEGAPFTPAQPPATRAAAAPSRPARPPAPSP